MSALRDIPLERIDGTTTSLAEYSNGPVLVVNVASKCGFTPQYEQLQQLSERYGNRGLAVLGFPCNQFLGQEPGTADEIQQFCRTSYGVTFPLFAKVKVNGHDRHPLFAALCEAPDAKGHAGRVRWNFEKFLVRPDDRIVRFRSATRPDAPEVIAAIDEALAPAPA